MNRILIITTRNCESCKIVEEKVRHIVRSIKKDEIFLSVKDREDVEKKFLKLNRITDFPVTLLYKDENLAFKIIGNYPEIVISQWIHNFLLHS